MNSFVRINAMVNKSPAGNPRKSMESIKDLIIMSDDGDINIFPSMSLLSPSSGSLFAQRDILKKCSSSLYEIADLTKDREGFYFLGLPATEIFSEGECPSRKLQKKPTPAVACIYKGEIIGFLPDFASYDFLSACDFGGFLPPDTLFSCGDLKFTVSSCDEEDILEMASYLSKTGCNLMVFTSYKEKKASSLQKYFDRARIISETYNIAVLLVNGGAGDTSSPYIYEGAVCLFENGENTCLSCDSQKAISETFDLDSEIFAGAFNVNESTGCHIEPIEKTEFLKGIDKYPFVPSSGFLRDAYLDELFSLQVSSLSKRLLNTGIRHAVLGVSGGLDSTLALMAACCAFDEANLPRENLYCITMPGFGTSDRTYYNALGLMEALGVTKEDISIRASVLQHFEDIGHNPDDKNVTYENAQARERTQILMDISNEINGFVIGTGDLSESALGWCTFGGDSIAGFNLNICIPKTVVKLLVERLASTKRIPGTESYLLDVLSTPVSPELLPSDERGEIAQKTEEIIGSYDLHDFFLYYLLKYGFSPEKLFFYACCAFEEDIPQDEIKDKLIIFLKRFYRSQFKRTLAPDCADITEVNLSNGNYVIPSDLDIHDIMEEAENIAVRY